MKKAKGSDFYADNSQNDFFRGETFFRKQFFRKGHIYLFKTYGAEHKPGKNYESCHPFGKLPEIIIASSAKEAKKKEYAIILNDLQEGVKTRTKDSFGVSTCIFIDIDQKPDKANQIEEFKTDTGGDIEAFLSKIKKDPYVYIAGKSASGKGLRLIFLVIHPAYLLLESDTEGEVKFTVAQIAKFHKENFDHVMSYLTKTYNLQIKSYLDTCSERITQYTFQISPEEVYINPEFHIFNLDDPKVESITESFKQRTNENSIKLSENVNKVIADNNKYLDELRLRHKDVIPMSSEEKIRAHFKNYNYPVLVAAKYLTTTNQAIICRFIRYNYRGDTKSFFKELSLKTFQDYLNTVSGIPQLSFRKMFQDCGVLLIDPIPENEDTVGNCFNEILSLAPGEYLEAVKPQLRKILSEQPLIVINAAAGDGKTTELTKYLLDLVIKEKKPCIYLAPKNFILKQIYQKWSKYCEVELSGQCQLIRNYETHLKGCDLNQPALILSSYASYWKVKHINYRSLVIDECHVLVKFADINDEEEDKCYEVNPSNADQTIYASATPEQSLLGLNDYYYLKIQRQDTSKKTVKVLETAHPIATILDLVTAVDPAKKIIIFNNNKNENKDLAKQLNTGGTFDFRCIQSGAEQNRDYLEIINNSRLLHNHYITTEILSEGVNILNEDWDIIYILNNFTIDYYTLYQFVNRFRKCTPEFIFITPPFGFHEIKGDPITNLKKHYLREHAIATERCRGYNEGEMSDVIAPLLKSQKAYFNDQEQKYEVLSNRLKKELWDGLFKYYYKRRELYLAKLSYFFNLEFILDPDPHKDWRTKKKFNLVDLKAFYYEYKDELYSRYLKNPGVEIEIDNTFEWFGTTEDNVITTIWNQYPKKWTQIFRRQGKLEKLLANLPNLHIEEYLFLPESVFKRKLKNLQLQAILDTNPTAPSDIAIKDLASNCESFLKVNGECLIEDLERHLGIKMDMVLDYRRDLKRIIRQLGYRIVRTHGKDQTKFIEKIKKGI